MIIYSRFLSKMMALILSLTLCVVATYADAYGSNKAVQAKNAEEARAAVIEGYNYYNAGNYIEAIKCYDEAIEAVPEAEAGEAAWAGKLLIFNKLGLYEEAVDCYYVMMNINKKTNLLDAEKERELLDTSKERELAESASGSAKVSFFPIVIGAITIAPEVVTAGSILAAGVIGYFIGSNTAKGDTYNINVTNGNVSVIDEDRMDISASINRTPSFIVTNTSFQIGNSINYKPAI